MANRSTLTAQITRPVDFQRRVEELYDSGHRVFVEFGPGGVLSGLVERVLAGRDVTVIPTDFGPSGDGAAALKEAALRLAVLGVPLHNVNRYDPLAPVPVIPSQVAQSLEGPNFAVTRVRDTSYRELLATDHRLASVQGVPEDPVRTDDVVVSWPTPEPAAMQLSQIAAEHLELHTRFIDGQLCTARELVDLAGAAADSASAEIAAREIAAISDHSIALGRAHMRANEAFGELVRLDRPPVPVANPQGERPSARAAEPVAEPPVQQRPEVIPSADPLPEPDPPIDDYADTAELVRQIIADKTGFPLDAIGLDLDIQSDLGIDSLAQIEIAAELWRHFPSIPREAMYRLATGRTVGDFIALAEQMLAESSAEPSKPTTLLPLGRAHVALRTLHEVDLRLDAFRPGAAALVVDDGGAVAAATIAALEQAGWRTRVLALPDVSIDYSAPSRVLDDWTEPALADALSALLPEDGILDLAVVALTETGSIADAIRRLSHTLFIAKRLQPALASGATETTRAALVTVTALDGALGFAGSQGRAEQALLGGVGALIRTVALESDGVFCRSLDYTPRLAAERVAERLLLEIADAAIDLREVGYDGTARCTPELTGTPALLPVPATGTATAEVTESDLFLVTGGARGITSWCVIEMARRYRCGFLLLGRTPLSGGPNASAEEQEVELTLETLRALGVRAEYLAADVTDTEAVAAALAPHAHSVTGLLHGAGVLADQWLMDKTAAAVARVLGPKLIGLDAALSALDAERLRHLVLFTSVTAFNGNLRQSDYAMANDALNRFACAWKAGHPACRVAAVAFGPWEGGMANEAMQEIFRQQGVPMLSRDRGTALFVEQLDVEHRDHLVTLLGPTAPLFQQSEPLASSGVTVRRDLTGIATHPVLRDHAFDKKVPVLPLSAAIGWCAHNLEGMSGGRPVVEARDFVVGHGLVFDGSEQDRFDLTATPALEGPDWAHVAIHSHRDAEPAVLRYKGSFRTAAVPTDAPRVEGLDAYELPPFEPHPYYVEGFFFHGPTLSGIGPELDVGPDRLVVMAQMPAPALPGFSGRLYNGATSDLLPQAAQLLDRRLTGRRGLPLKVDAVEIFAALPDDEPFLIVVELEEQRAMDTRYTVTACLPDGRVLLRWKGLTMLTITPDMLADGKWGQFHALVQVEQSFGTVHHA